MSQPRLNNEELALLQLFVACLGTLAVLICLGLGLYFCRASKRIGRAVGYDKFAEGFLSFMTLVFALTAEGVWHLGLSPTSMAIMRISMFSVSILCSAHLAYATWQIEHDDRSN